MKEYKIEVAKMARSRAAVFKIMEEEINNWVKEGWELHSITDNAYVLVRKK